jgi:flagellar basal body-associated protein FliL
LPAATKGNDVELLFLLFTLLCPLSMVGLMGWWAWSMRRTSKSDSGQAPVRSATDENEITRMRAQLDQLEAQTRDDKSRAAG